MAAAASAAVEAPRAVPPRPPRLPLVPRPRPPRPPRAPVPRLVAGGTLTRISAAAGLDGREKDMLLTVSADVASDSELALLKVDSEAEKLPVTWTCANLRLLSFLPPFLCLWRRLELPDDPDTELPVLTDAASSSWCADPMVEGGGMRIFWSARARMRLTISSMSTEGAVETECGTPAPEKPAAACIGCICTG